jgi:hypothetical protein
MIIITLNSPSGTGHCAEFVQFAPCERIQLCLTYHCGYKVDSTKLCQISILKNCSYYPTKCPPNQPEICSYPEWDSCTTIKRCSPKREKCSPNRRHSKTPKRCSPKRCSPKRCSPKRCSPKKCSPKRCSPKREKCIPKKENCYPKRDDYCYPKESECFPKKWKRQPTYSCSPSKKEDCKPNNCNSSYFSKSPESKPPKELQDEIQCFFSPFKKNKCEEIKCKEKEYCKSPQKKGYRNKQVVITRNEEFCSPKKDECKPKECNDKDKRRVKNYKYEIKESTNLSKFPL